MINYPILRKVPTPLSSATLEPKSLTHGLWGGLIIQTSAPLNKNIAEDWPSVIRDSGQGIKSLLNCPDYRNLVNAY